jgi:dethiobiotin synthetase
MTASFFITGTDTNVGKTVLSALLTAALEAVYWKPVQSGACEGTDRQAVMRWSEVAEDQTRPECYCFDPPVSPHLAARETGVTIEINKINLPAVPGGAPLIVEGAGGILTPLNESETVLDLVAHLELPALVASRTTLGTINHTLLTLAALGHAGVDVRGVVMLGHENLENRRAIEHYGKVPVVGRVPWLDEINRRALIEVFERGFDERSFY